jgi:hypothetical protein
MPEFSLLVLHDREEFLRDVSDVLTSLHIPHRSGTVAAATIGMHVLPAAPLVLPAPACVHDQLNPWRCAALRCAALRCAALRCAVLCCAALPCRRWRIPPCCCT